MPAVSSFFENLFEYESFRPFSQGGEWTLFHGWFYIISDLLIWSACIVIPIILVAHVIKKSDAPRFSGFHLLFTLFLVICGITFFIDALTFWYPLYRLSAFLRFFTGVVSWVFVAHALKNTSALMSIRTGKDFQSETATRAEVERELKQKNEQLQEAERLAKLGYIKWNVADEQVEYSDSVPEILEVGKDKPLTYQMLSTIVLKEDMKNLEKVIDTIFIKKFFPNFYCRIKTPDNEIKHLLVVGQIILSPTGAITAVKGTVQDVTEQRLYIHKIQKQNQQLKDIAWIQSHKVRAPVASILGLVQLFNQDKPEDAINKEVLDGVTEAAQTLDSVIKEINAKTEAEKDEPEDEEPI